MRVEPPHRDSRARYGEGALSMVSPPHQQIGVKYGPERD